jgi:hypothetical protein
VVRIDIALEDIIQGEKLKSDIVSKLASQGVSLVERHEGLHSRDMPRILGIEEVDDQLRFSIDYNGQTYDVPIAKVSDATLKAGLAMSYGHGIFRYDYNLPAFGDLSGEELKLYMDLAVEVWEKNTHVDWMRKCGYTGHNGTKDETFFYQRLHDGRLAIDTHRQRSEQRDKGDTPHHVFRDPEVLREVMLSEGEHPLSKYLIEAIYDQTTATTRIWYKERHKPFEQRITENRGKGFFIDAKSRWTPGCFGFTNDYETEIWQTWIKAHEEFKAYWISKFGNNEELWQPPAPVETTKE